MEQADREKIDGSGLFFWNSSLPDTEKLELVEWYKGLSKEDQSKVDKLRSEATDEADFFAQSNEA
jgi:hypothetical protein